MKFLPARYVSAGLFPGTIISLNAALRKYVTPEPSISCAVREKRGARAIPQL